MSLLRKQWFLGTLLVAGVVWAKLSVGDEEVTNLVVGPHGASLGETLAISVEVNRTPMSVTFTSTPPGLVEHTVLVNSKHATFPVPTSPNAPERVYKLNAAPTNGGIGRLRDIRAYIDHSK